MRHFSIAGDGEEWLANLMHSRPIVVGTQTQHQLEDSLVRFRANHSSAPWQDTPVLIIDENATISNRRTLFGGIASAQEHICFIGRAVRPPFPRRNTDKSGNFQQPVCQAMGICTMNEQFAILNLKMKSLSRHASIEYRHDVCLRLFIYSHQFSVQHLLNV